ncbi:homeobox HMX2 isoform A [Chlorella sorokiniana]|uniref:Homeobox HMX2 isoform A n=1 Tax=Chlorella sorokiniana TaxID=3076 RepID=A0A2P6TCX6_CHLSO|nr:homeobox HMX2 isoform A [Chlorella sorokiniana]|eukprot:PRW20504.1 homeobox HMX2 isoform A [Chlorella sorokiniana]
MPAEEGKPGQFKASKSAAELAYGDVAAAGGKHLETYWFRGSGGLRPEGHDYSEEGERLHELEEHQKGGAVRRVMGTAGSAIASAAAAVTPARFKASKSAAELAMGDSEGYTEPGLAEHKDHPAKHLGTYWHRGSAGLRPEGHDFKEEEERLHELEEHQAGSGGVVERMQGAAAIATQTAKEYVQSAKEMLGLASEK